MPNGYDDDYRRGRYDRDYHDEQYYRRHGGGHEDSSQGYGGEPLYRGFHHSDYYNEPYRGRRPSGYYNEPYGAHDYGRYEYGDRAREPYYGRGHEGGYRESYYRGPYGRGAEERGFFEHVGDEIRSSFGDEEAAQRRRIDGLRERTYAGRGPRGYRRSDKRIVEDVNDRLTDDEYVDASDIEVNVNNCMVTLSGRVDSREEKRRAESIAESVTGVTDVSNQLRVGPSVPYMTETETTRARTARP